MLEKLFASGRSFLNEYDIVGRKRTAGDFGMAWRRQHSILKEDNPASEWDPPSADWLKQVRAEQRAPLEILPPGHHDFVWQFAGPSGIPYPRLPESPLVATVTNVEGPLPDAGLNIGVSSRIKDLIERLEPDTHQFLPLKIRLPSGDIDEPRWMMIVCNRVDALAPDHCSDVHVYHPRQKEHPDWFYYRSNEDGRMRLAVHSDRIAGMAIWYDWRFRDFFFSEALGQSFMNSGIRGYCLPADELDRSNHVHEI